MPTTQILPIPPTTRGSALSQTDHMYLLMMQGLSPLYKVDTSEGSYEEEAPPAGLNSSTGQSGQCKEVTYTKVSADANVFTLNGVELGPYTLTTQGQTLKIKSDSTFWWKVG